MINKSGITYYKLESKYVGDVTKYCGLSGAEIDANFHFLRGYDIKSATYDQDKGELVLTRVNGSKIVIEGIKNEIETIIDKTTAKIDMTGTYFDGDKLELHLVLNGDEYIVGGFKLERTVFSDDTLYGNGMNEDPLKISRTVMSGFHLPAKGFVNVLSGETFPTIIEKDDIYLSLESISPYGLLYNHNGLEKIKEALEGNVNGWRVPSVKEWGDMLNYLEECEDRNHNSENTGRGLGYRAGLYIKSKDGEWDINPEDYEGCVDSYLFKALPTGYARRDGTYHCFGETTNFWTADMHEDLNKAYCRRLDDHEDTVYKTAEELTFYYSLRLVRDLTDTCSDVEVISGVPYHTVLMQHIDEENNVTTKVWTQDNVSFTGLLSDGDNTALPVVNNRTGEVMSGSPRYFVNAWTGKYWDKRELLENEVIVLAVGPDGSENEEWVLLNGELVKRSDIYTEIVYNNIIGPITEMISAETVSRMEADNELWEALSAETQERIDGDKELLDVISGETEARIEADNELWEALSAETQERMDADNELWGAFSAETEARMDADNELWEALSAETQDRMDADNELWEALSAETEERKAEDAELWEVLSAETQDRMDADNELWEALSAETEERKAEDAELWEALSAETEERKAADAEEAEIREANDIKVQEYELKVADPNCGVVLLTNGGQEIKITVDGDFGEFVGEEP